MKPIARLLRSAVVATLAAVVSPAAVAVVLAAPPGDATHTFDVAATHSIIDSESGEFLDSYLFSLASPLSAAATAIYFNGDIEGFAAGLYGSAGLIATGAEAGLGAHPQNPVSYMNTIYVGSLQAGDYELRISGFDVYQDVVDPYSLTISVAPLASANRPGVLQVSEPASIALVLTSLLALTIRRSRRS